MDIVKAILEIETKAQEIESSVDELAKKIRRETDGKIAELQKAADSDSDAKIEKIKTKLASEKAASLDAVKGEMESVQNALMQKYSENREKWIEEITAAVIKGDEE